MKAKELRAKLKKAGWVIMPGGRHDLATHPDVPGVKLVIPRHNEINEYTAQAVLKKAGLHEGGQRA